MDAQPRPPDFFLIGAPKAARVRSTRRSPSTQSVDIATIPSDSSRVFVHDGPRVRTLAPVVKDYQVGHIRSRWVAGNTRVVSRTAEAGS